MSDLAGQTTQQLFSRWRTGDATAGQAMAQRFSDWYYAISASRLGETNCRPALERACQRFAQGVASVTEAGKLADWAHKIIAEEIQMAGGRVEGGDHPNALTNQRSPTELLQAASKNLDESEVRLLGLAYDSSQSLDAVKAEADKSGGYPLAVLKARYALKRSLRSDGGVPFTEVPEKPNLDWGPLPLYECGRMAQGKEEKAFETWMLSDLTLCKDIAEFAAFALALRGGAWKQSAPAVSRPPPPPERPERVSRDDDFEPESTGPNMVVIGGVAAVGLLAVAGAVAWFLM
ncbi:MAG: hypothetical protein GY913_08655 [Proteobacteria bacterium]|nr:hypothetical protein [Pseudomonadota bacterium]MCP4916981.1 hypothetical protein [Pseudomonadota bacterium]